MEEREESIEQCRIYLGVRQISIGSVSKDPSIAGGFLKIRDERTV